MFSHTAMALSPSLTRKPCTLPGKLPFRIVSDQNYGTVPEGLVIDILCFLVSPPTPRLFHRACTECLGPLASLFLSLARPFPSLVYGHLINQIDAARPSKDLRTPSHGIECFIHVGELMKPAYLSNYAPPQVFLKENIIQCGHGG